MRQSRRNPKLKLQNFRNLPSEVIIHIISRLPTRSIAICKCVCKSWRDLIRTRELLKSLPSEIVIEILSRLPIRTIGICKCVRKSWRDLIQTRQFVDSHLSKSVAGMVVCHDYNDYNVVEFKNEELDREDPEGPDDPLTRFDCSELLISICEIICSVNGLIFLHPMSSIATDYYICNPITREYIEFPFEPRLLDAYFYETVNYGFGVSKVSHQYKVVRIVDIRKAICHIYTLGTGKWRRIDPGPPLGKNKHPTGAFLNGCLHWFVEGSHMISCFDLETETFSTFSHPPLPVWKRFQILVVLGDYLCICDNQDEDEIVIWLMKKYGDENSWTKEFVIQKSPELISRYSQSYGIVYPIKIFEDGHVLMTWEHNSCMFSYMFYYSNTTKTTTLIDDHEVFGIVSCGSMQAMLHTPSFLSLKSFPKEYVKSFSRPRRR